MFHILPKTEVNYKLHRVKLTEFWNFVFSVEVKIFLISGRLSYDGGLYFWGGCQFSLCPCSHFEMQDFKNSKIFAFGALIFNILIFKFNIDAGVPVDIDLILNQNFLVQGAVSFHPQWALKANKLSNWLV